MKHRVGKNILFETDEISDIKVLKRIAIFPSS